MSVVILGKNIKKSSNNCGTCRFSKQRDDNVVCPFEKVDGGCPVRELPKVHGRLKDVDRIIALSKEAFNEVASQLRPYVTPSEAIGLLVEVLDNEDAAPTIIEAEGGE